jgi:hypothetical protein
MTGLETPGLGGMRGEGDQAGDISIARAGVEEDRLDEEQQVGAGGMEEDQRRQLDGEQLVRAARHRGGPTGGVQPGARCQGRGAGNGRVDRRRRQT